MDRGKKAVHYDNTKKVKSTDLVWRTVSSLASAGILPIDVTLHHAFNYSEYCPSFLIFHYLRFPACFSDAVEENSNLIDGSEGNNMECGISGCVSDVQGAIKESNIAIVHSESAANSDAASDCNLDDARGTNSRQCFGKHDVSIKVRKFQYRYACLYDV